MSEKKNLLILVDYFLPGFKAGGPIRSISNLTSALSDDFNIYILTRDHDFGEVEKYESITSNQWVQVGSANVFYLSIDKSLCWFFRKEFAKLESPVIYINSFFSLRFSIIFFLLRKVGLVASNKVVLAPRGELSDGAMQIKSFKKKFYLGISKFLGIYKNVRWHVTSADEKKYITELFGSDVEIYFVENLVSLEEWSLLTFERKEKASDSLKLVFLSRITKKKNLRFALNVLEPLNNINIIFDIYGPIEDKEYFDECLKVIESLPESISVSYKGEVKHSDVQRVLAQYDLFILPTLNENFGQIIWESLASGCPILISDQTPWKSLKESGVGADISLLSIDSFSNEVKRYYSMSSLEHSNITVCARNYAHKVANKPEAIQLYKNMLIC